MTLGSCVKYSKVVPVAFRVARMCCVTVTLYALHVQMPKLWQLSKHSRWKAREWVVIVDVTARRQANDNASVSGGL